MKGIIGLLTISLLVVACQNPTGPTFPVLDGVEFQELEDQDFRCYMPSDTNNLDFDDQELIINSQEDFKDYFANKIENPICENATLPAINFEKSTLIGHYLSTGGCTGKFERKLFYDGSHYAYVLHVESSGFCEKLIQSMNWAVIPKTDSVDFVIE